MHAPRDYHVNRWWTFEETRASIWDSSLPGLQDAELDDGELRKRLLSVHSMWKTEDIKQGSEPRIILVTASGTTSRKQTPLQLREETLQYLVEMGGFDKSTTNDFLRNWLPFHHLRFEYDDSDKPTYMTLAVRLPRQSETVVLLLRTHLSTFTTFAFLACNQAADLTIVREHLVSNALLLLRHPLYIVSLLYQTRYQKWSEGLASLWHDINEIEALTKMSPARWIVRNVEAERQCQLSNVNKLMAQLYGLRLEMDHTRTVMAVEKRFRAFCVETMEEMERRRGELDSVRGLGRRERAEWEDMVTATARRFDAVGDRVVELRERLQGQIEVVHNMIARRNSEVALTMAQLQSHDSRMVKGIAILTLLFLPSTLISTMWTTGIFHLEGEANWQFFAGTTILLTLLVLLGWAFYVHRSKKHQAKHWPLRAQIDSLDFSMV